MLFKIYIKYQILLKKLKKKLFIKKIKIWFNESIIILIGKIFIVIKLLYKNKSGGVLFGFTWRKRIIDETYTYKNDWTIVWNSFVKIKNLEIIKIRLQQIAS